MLFCMTIRLILGERSCLTVRSRKILSLSGKNRDTNTYAFLTTLSERVRPGPLLEQEVHEIGQQQNFQAANRTSDNESYIIAPSRGKAFIIYSRREIEQCMKLNHVNVHAT